MIISNNPSVGVSEVEGPRAFVYPNPSDGIFNIALRDVPGSVQIVVTNVMGKVVKSSLLDGNEAQINLSEEPSGIYFINISGGIFNEQVKVVKE